MSIDVSLVGTVAAEMMERIASEYGEDATVGTVAIVVEVDIPSTADEPGRTYVTYRCTDPRRWIQVGLFEAGRRAVLDD